MKIDGEDAGGIRPDMKKHIVELSHRRTAGHKRENQGVPRAGPDVGKDSGATLKAGTP